jgi:hypothetical protein
LYVGQTNVVKLTFDKLTKEQRQVVDFRRFPLQPVGVTGPTKNNGLIESKR